MDRRRVPHVGLLMILVLIGTFNVVDFAVTLSFVVYGDYYEISPLMRRLIGTPYFAVYKLVMIPIGLVFLWNAPRRIVQRMKGLVLFVLAIYGLLMIYFLVMVF